MNKRKILVTGSLGQIGSELVMYLRKEYGNDNVIASDIEKKDVPKVIGSGPFEKLDVLKANKTLEICKKYGVNTVIHLAALLSAVAEKNPKLAYDINMNGLYNMLEIAREQNYTLFVPSSIAAFGPSTPADKTPQDTIQRPTSMYGVTKVAGELLCDYYHKKFGVDTRGVRFPGLISYEALPGGGTTDYAVHIYYEALKNNAYTSFIKKGTLMDMMYMPDALMAIHKLLEADAAKLKHRNAFNITAMSFAPETIAAEIKKHLPKFKISYDVDPVRQAIANSWPNSLDDSCAKKEWGWKPKYNLETMTKDMLEQLSKKLNIELPAASRPAVSVKTKTDASVTSAKKTASPKKPKTSKSKK
ncbi:L-threonine 3-dehydrogenase [Treponema pedis]|uniref:L-threonine 3-dehydrogenase n=1 Tax=Treponema pedis TaxID=409322 RepID=A0A7S7AW10_9SPIR|nr:L-threonine 3-dehydrogenase [Treponema pedis]QOW60141.1 L-threonine 3-dehydrogenase [Treponema pedis]